MKIINLLRQLSSPRPDVTTEAVVIPDSAMVLQGRPVFVPDIADAWKVVYYVALRIGRLGRDINARFAPRYVDAVTVAGRLVADDCAHALSAGLLSAMDSSVAPGEWLDISSLGPTITVDAGDSSATVDLVTEIAAAVPAVSRYMTLKMGDIILAGAFAAPEPVEPGMRLNASIDSRPVLSVKIV